MDIYESVERLLWFALEKGFVDKTDLIYFRNCLYSLLKLKHSNHSPDFPEEPCEHETVCFVLEGILNYCVENELIGDGITARDLMDARIMGLLTPLPSRVKEIFYDEYARSASKATEYFYKLCRDVNYIQVDRVAKNLYWTTETEYGELEITVNLAKPEKDPKDIIAAGKAPSTSYPKCLLCVENVGFEGSFNHPARQNLRVIPLELDGEEWYFQYSPYVYYNEHCIVINKTHRPMEITDRTFVRLFDFIDFLPDYFIGSNADLPIVGGSILSHDHFQGGRHVFPMEKAEPLEFYESDGFRDVSVSVVKWPMSVIRIAGDDRRRITELSNHFLTIWREYSDEAAQILAHSEGKNHNTVTPIARKNKNNEYEMDLVLRNNRTSAEHPLGIFHPHEELHHIKKENIGLIEVMGLAVLPGRLHREMAEMEKCLTGESEVQPEGLSINESHPLYLHRRWLYGIVNKYGKKNSREQAQSILRDEISKVFLEVLIDAAVFKPNKIGRQHFSDFMRAAGFVVME